MANLREDFEPVNAAKPCPLCRNTQWCLRSKDGAEVICQRVESDRRYGDAGWFHAVGDSKDAAGKAQRAPAETLNRVYVALIGLLTLSPAHRDALLKRGFTLAEIAAQQYRTLPRLSERGDLLARLEAQFGQTSANVPGFFSVAGKVGLARLHGLLVPVRQLGGDIVALKVRVDEPVADQRYFYLSSTKHDGPSPGAPAHVPLGVRQTCERVRLTEGELKADLATVRTGVPTLSFPGVAAWRKCLPVLEQLGTETVVLAFDADADRKTEVACALAACATELRGRKYAVELELWKEDDGKGLDDLLAAGKHPELLQGDAASTAIAATVERAGARAQTPHRPPESFDDYHRLARTYLAKHWTNPDGLELRSWNGEWLAFKDNVYSPLPGVDVRGLLCRHIKAEFDATHISRGSNIVSRHVPKVSSGCVNNVLMALSSLALLPGGTTPPAWLYNVTTWAASEMLVTRNWLIHLPSFIAGMNYCHKPTPAFFTRTALDYDFDSNARVPKAWLKFLHDLWPNDPESVRLLQEFFGLCLAGNTQFQKILLVCGPRRSGKGTIARVLRAVIGPENVAGPTLSSLATNFGLWPLLGKAVAVVSDARLSSRTDTSIVTERLLSISGEDALTIDRKHLPPITCKLGVRFVILTNELPRFGDASNALAGRFLLLPLTKSFFGREDKTLTDRLSAERAGILLWAVEGWKRLRERGHFVQPRSSADLFEELEELNSPISAFVRECCVVETGKQVEVKALYSRWKRWCLQKGRVSSGDEQTFGRNLRAAVLGVSVSRPHRGSERVRVYNGVALLPVPEPGPRRSATQPIASEEEQQKERKEQKGGCSGVDCGPARPSPKVRLVVPVKKPALRKKVARL